MIKNRLKIKQQIEQIDKLMKLAAKQYTNKDKDAKRFKEAQKKWNKTKILLEKHMKQ